MRDEDTSIRNIELIRHGATKLNNDDVSVDRIRSWKDIPLSASGRAEAKKLGAKLRGDKPDVIVSSDLLRACETAEIIALATGSPLWDITRDFRPWNVGKFAGEVTERAVPILARYACDEPDERIPGGESFSQFKTRFFCGLCGALEKHAGIVAVVTHHRCERLLLAWLRAGSPTDATIDLATFTQRGEHTGHVEFVTLDMDNLRAASEWLRGEHGDPAEHDRDG